MSDCDSDVSESEGNLFHLPQLVEEQEDDDSVGSNDDDGIDAYECGQELVIDNEDAASLIQQLLKNQ